MRKRINLYDAYAVKSKRRLLDTIRNFSALILIGFAIFILSYSATIFLDEQILIKENETMRYVVNDITNQTEYASGLKIKEKLDAQTALKGKVSDVKNILDQKTELTGKVLRSITSAQLNDLRIESINYTSGSGVINFVTGDMITPGEFVKNLEKLKIFINLEYNGISSQGEAGYSGSVNFSLEGGF